MKNTIFSLSKISRESRGFALPIALMALFIMFSALGAYLKDSLQNAALSKRLVENEQARLTIDQGQATTLSILEQGLSNTRANATDDFLDYPVEVVSGDPGSFKFSFEVDLKSADQQASEVVTADVICRGSCGTTSDNEIQGEVQIDLRYGNGELSRLRRIFGIVRPKSVFSYGVRQDGEYSSKGSGFLMNGLLEEGTSESGFYFGLSSACVDSVSDEDFATWSAGLGEATACNPGQIPGTPPTTPGEDYVPPHDDIDPRPDGFYTSAILDGVSVFHGHLTFGDIDEDGDIDIFNCSSSGHGWGGHKGIIFKNDGTGKFSSHEFVQWGDPSDSFMKWPSKQCRLTDVNSDGHLDLILVREGHLDNGFITRHGDGTGYFSPPQVVEWNVSPKGAVFDDFNNDGTLDILTKGDKVGDTFQYQIFSSDGAGNYTESAVFSLSSQPDFAWLKTFKSVDFNKDGFPDLITHRQDQQWAGPRIDEIYLNNGDGTFNNTADFTDSPILEDVWGITDIDGDGFVDILSGTHATDHFSIFYGDSFAGTSFTSSFTESSNFDFGSSTNYNPHGIGSLDINEDGTMDLWLSITNAMSIPGVDNPGTFSIYWGEGGKFNFSDMQTFLVPPVVMSDGAEHYTNHNMQRYMIDLNNDSKKDLVVFGHAGHSGNSVPEYPFDHPIWILLQGSIPNADTKEDGIAPDEVGQKFDPDNLPDDVTPTEVDTHTTTNQLDLNWTKEQACESPQDTLLTQITDWRDSLLGTSPPAPRQDISCDSNYCQIEIAGTTLTVRNSSGAVFQQMTLSTGTVYHSTKPLEILDSTYSGSSSNVSIASDGDITIKGNIQIDSFVSESESLQDRLDRFDSQLVHAERVAFISLKNIIVDATAIKALTVDSGNLTSSDQSLSVSTFATQAANYPGATLQGNFVAGEDFKVDRTLVIHSRDIELAGSIGVGGQIKGFYTFTGVDDGSATAVCNLVGNRLLLITKAFGQKGPPGPGINGSSIQIIRVKDITESPVTASVDP